MTKQTQARKHNSGRTTQIMTPEHPLWNDFYERLIEACERNCDADIRCPAAQRILKRLGFSDSECEMSVEHFHSKGGYSDLEVLLNVDNG